MGVTENSCSFRLVLEGNAGKEMSDSSKLEFLEKNLANNFALSDAEDKNLSTNLSHDHIYNILVTWWNYVNDVMGISYDVITFISKNL